MNFFKRNIWTICLILTAVLISEPTMAAEGQGTLIGIAKSKALTTFQNVKSIIGAIFGKIKWSAFASLAVGLAILAAAGAIVQYATGDTEISATGRDGFGDTFQDSATN